MHTHWRKRHRQNLLGQENSYLSQMAGLFFTVQAKGSTPLFHCPLTPQQDTKDGLVTRAPSLSLDWALSARGLTWGSETQGLEARTAPRLGKTAFLGFNHRAQVFS